MKQKLLSGLPRQPNREIAMLMKVLVNVMKMAEEFKEIIPKRCNAILPLMKLVKMIYYVLSLCPAK